MISRRTFTEFLVKSLSIGYFVPFIELLESCTYTKKELPAPGNKKIQLLSPDGGEHFEQVNTITVVWSSENIKSINILLSYDQGLSWKYLKKGIQAFSEKEILELPMFDIFAENCLLKLEDSEDKSIHDISTTTFSISKGIADTTIQLLSPANQEILMAGELYEIKWLVGGSSNFTIYLLLDGHVGATIASNVQGNSYTWQVNNLISKNAKIKITDFDNTAVYDVNATPFTIGTKFTIDLTIHPELQNTGGYKIFNDSLLGTFIVKKTSPDEYTTYSMSCTHNGCLINLLGDQSFSCSCHGSAFDVAGNVTNGPADRPLDQWRTLYFLTENKIVVYSYQ